MVDHITYTIVEQTTGRGRGEWSCVYVCELIIEVFSFPKKDDVGDSDLATDRTLSMSYV